MTYFVLNITECAKYDMICLTYYVYRCKYDCPVLNMTGFVQNTFFPPRKIHFFYYILICATYFTKFFLHMTRGVLSMTGFVPSYDWNLP